MRDIKKIRLHLNLDQAQMAKELGLTRQTISNWETGHTKSKRMHDCLCSIVSKKGLGSYFPDYADKKDFSSVRSDVIASVILGLEVARSKLKDAVASFDESMDILKSID